MPDIEKITTYVGPQVEETKKGRKKFSLSDNKTASLAAQAFPLETETKKTTRGGVRIQVEKEISEVEVLAKFKESVFELAQRRIAGFYQQLILAYNTRLHFEVGKTVDQAESAPARTLITEKDEVGLKIKMDASHNSAIPCLYACNREKWNEYCASLETDERLPKPDMFVYMKDSYAYFFWNSTLEMPKSFNTGVDNTVDLGQKGLRRRGIELLNEAANDDISPEAALKQFLAEFLTIVRREKRRAEDNPLKAAGLSYYEEELLEIKAFLDEGLSSFQSFLSVRISADENEKIYRTIYEIRYDAIRENTRKQSEIAAKINEVWQKICSQWKRCPAYAETAFHELLIDNSKNAADQVRFKIFFSAPYFSREDAQKRKKINEAKEKIKAVQIPVDPKVHKKNETGEEIIQRLAKELSLMMKTMRVNEQEQRAITMRKLRQMRDLTQKDLSSSIKEHFPDTPASNATISRCETGVRAVDALYAEKLSRVFKVDPALFMPAFFNE